MGNEYFDRDGDRQYIGRGYGGGYGGGYGDGGLGGIGAIIALVVVVAILWFLAREGKNNDGCYGGGYPPYAPYAYPPYGGKDCCNSALDCRIPMAPDMSNCEVDKDIWKIDAHMEKCCCETQKEILADGSKTRELISANYLQELRDKLAEKASEVSALKTQQYTDNKFDALYGKLSCYDRDNDKQYWKLDNKIDSLICEIPKRPPIWCEGITPNTHHTDCRHDDFPHRGKFDDCCGCNCGC